MKGRLALALGGIVSLLGINCAGLVAQVVDEEIVDSEATSSNSAVLTENSDIADVILYASKKFNEITGYSVVIHDGYAMSEFHKSHFNDIIGLMKGSVRAVINNEGRCTFQSVKKKDQSGFYVADEIYAVIDKNGDRFLDPTLKGNEAGPFRENFLCLCKMTGGKISDKIFDAVKLAAENPNKYCGKESEQWFRENAKYYLAQEVHE